MHMLRKTLLGAALICSLATVAPAQSPEAPLTNGSVLKLVKAGFKEKTIVAIISSRPNQFNLETEQLIQLKRNGVSENIILAMMSLSGIPVEDSEQWEDDESFFKRSTRQARESEQTNQQSGSTDIFGSSGGSKSQSRSRGSLGGNQNDSNVTGSATVRILRPPSEAGNAATKLERIPTLNNEAVIKLVEAGFSEGTIIKRIEESPVDFELSAEKLEELHKRRVTDPIIAAMTAAMGDLPQKSNPNQP
jgi:hypothetical protein